MKKTLVSILVASAFSPVLAYAEAGDWVVRARAVNINPSESSRLGRTTNNAWGGGAADSILNQGANLEVESNTIPELDISYYVTKNIALELILALGSKHDVNIRRNADVGQAVAGNRSLGDVNVLPPTLTVQWHFNPDQTFDPYIGAGLNLTRFMNNGLRLNDLGGQPIRVDRTSWGPALQAGFDINLQDGWLLNFDVKKLWIDTDVRMNLLGNGYRRIDRLDIDPLVVGVGFGKKF